MKKIFSAARVIVGLAFFALLLVPLFGLPLWVEVSGQVAQGEVVDKREDITVRRTSWTRRLYLDVRYLPADTGAPEQTTIIVEPGLFDRTRVGAQVMVRYLPQPGLRPLGSLLGMRLEEQPAFGQMRAQLAGASGWLAGIAVWLLLLLLWSRWRRWWLALPLFLMAAGAGVYALSDWPLPAPPGPQRQAEATVRDTHRIDRLFFRSRGRSGSNNRATQPYMIVELQFTPQGAADPVVAVDLVDEGSVAGLEPGAELPIRYSVADPRWAQIDGAQRTYAWKNITGYGAGALVILALLLGGWAFARLRSARRGGPAARP